ncbi:TPA: hypothetical protein HA246_05070 [Candidatus Woesearchaeota archaeon]|nr:hypothetical protein [Candidatus Woesearchaeota archaeon]
MSRSNLTTFGIGTLATILALTPVPILTGAGSAQAQQTEDSKQNARLARRILSNLGYAVRFGDNPLSPYIEIAESEEELAKGNRLVTGFNSHYDGIDLPHLSASGSIMSSTYKNIPIERLTRDLISGLLREIKKVRKEILNDIGLVSRIDDTYQDEIYLALSTDDLNAGEYIRVRFSNESVVLPDGKYMSSGEIDAFGLGNARSIILSYISVAKSAKQRLRDLDFVLEPSTTNPYRVRIALSDADMRKGKAVDVWFMPNYREIAVINKSPTPLEGLTRNTLLDYSGLNSQPR